VQANFHAFYETKQSFIADYQALMSVKIKRPVLEKRTGL
jgi:hypothetical protein